MTDGVKTYLSGQAQINALKALRYGMDPENSAAAIADVDNLIARISTQEAARRKDATTTPMSDTVTKDDLATVTRFEVIAPNGRLLTRYGVNVQLSLQDDKRTLKAFMQPRSYET